MGILPNIPGQTKGLRAMIANPGTWLALCQHLIGPLVCCIRAVALKPQVETVQDEKSRSKN